MIDQILNTKVFEKTDSLKWQWRARMHGKCVWLRRYRHTVWLTLTHAIQILFHFQQSFIFPVQCLLYCCRSEYGVLYTVVKPCCSMKPVCYFFPSFMCILYYFSSHSYGFLLSILHVYHSIRYTLYFITLYIK